MNDSSPEPRDPWAPPERPAVELGKAQGPHGTSGVSGPPSVHDQPTLAGMPGDRIPPSAPPRNPIPTQNPMPTTAPIPTTPTTGQPASAVYGYPAQPGYGYPGDAGYPGPPGYPGYQGYPGQGAYPPYGARRSNGQGTTALVLGILSVVGCFTSFFAIALGIAAVVFGTLGRGKASRGEADNGGMALAGIILGSIGIVLGALLLVVMFAGLMDEGPGEDSRYDSPYDNSQVREKV
ncbi:DUF4190 domain-containing protein [Streptomyces sp. NPDC090036]|uniref:DUF4190 domain-containing protein n=1 Tax=Streptomyces sp. NPDC090036 TaxID=3365926 RepID=UPI00381B4AE5